VSRTVEEFIRESLAEMNFLGPIDNDTPLGSAGLDIDSLTRAYLWIQLIDDFGAPLREGDLDRAREWTFSELVAVVKRRIDETQGG
jgi:acyl carrier protein